MRNKIIKMVLTLLLATISVLGCGNADNAKQEQLNRKEIELKKKEDSLMILEKRILRQDKKATEKKASNVSSTSESKWNLTGHEYSSENIIYHLNFYSDSKVRLHMYNFGVFEQRYSIKGDIIDVKMFKADPIQFKILNNKKLKLIKSPGSVGAIFIRVN